METWWSRARESGKSESRKGRSGGEAESERGKAERSGNVGKRSSYEGVPLTAPMFEFIHKINRKATHAPMAFSTSGVSAPGNAKLELRRMV